MSLDLSSVSSDAIFAEARRRLKCQKQGPRRVVLIGPPGCGKGTQVRTRTICPSTTFLLWLRALSETPGLRRSFHPSPHRRLAFRFLLTTGAQDQE
jgi:hypothetical protein